MPEVRYVLHREQFYEQRLHADVQAHRRRDRHAGRQPRDHMVRLQRAVRTPVYRLPEEIPGRESIQYRT